MTTKTKSRPRMLDDFPDYGAAKKRLAELEKQRGELKAKIDSLPNTEAGREQSTIAQKATALLTGKQADSGQPTPVELVEKIKVADQAIKLAKNAVDDARRKASAEICEDHLPKRRQLNADVIAGVEAATAAYAAVIAQDTELRKQNVLGNLPMIQFASWPLLGQSLRLLAGSNGKNLLTKLHRDNPKGKK